MPAGAMRQLYSSHINISWRQRVACPDTKGISRIRRALQGDADAFRLHPQNTVMGMGAWGHGAVYGLVVRWLTAKAAHS